MFKVGEKVVYPAHGVGQIEAIRTQVISGTEKRFYRRYRDSFFIFICLIAWDTPALAYIEPTIGGLLYQYFYLIANGILLIVFFRPIKHFIVTVKRKLTRLFFSKQMK